MKTYRDLETLLEDMKNDHGDERNELNDEFMPGGKFGLGDWDNLPTFGGPAITEDAVWSWDATRKIVGTCPDDVEIIDRDDIKEKGN